jgi:hypothetical protein
LKWYYYCAKCEPEGWDRFYPDLSSVEKPKQHTEKARKARSAKQKKQQVQYYKSMGIPIPDELLDHLDHA